MKTYKLTKKDIENKPVLAVGYKVFAPDWKTKHGDYCYADENGKVLNTIHTVDGDITECRWGLHFSKKPQDCFNFYESVQWNKFAKNLLIFSFVVGCHLKFINSQFFWSIVGSSQSMILCHGCLT